MRIAAALEFGVTRGLMHGAMFLAAHLALLGGPANAQGFAGPKISDAKPGELRVLATAAIREPLDAVLAQARRVVGRGIVVEYGSARGNLKDKILAGEDFEVAILLPDVNEELLRQGKILADSYELARVNVAIGLRGNATGVDVGTSAALKTALLKAKSVKYAPTGAAILTVRKVLSTLAVADAIKDSSRVREAVELGANDYELNLYPLSEIIPNKALKNLGPVIPELQVPAIITAVIGKHASDEAAARTLIKFLLGPEIDPALAADGMMKGVAAR
jgi:ABC-type molybdate transport system substrate-binding protein